MTATQAPSTTTAPLAVGDHVTTRVRTSGRTVVRTGTVVEVADHGRWAPGAANADRCVIVVVDHGGRVGQRAYGATLVERTPVLTSEQHGLLADVQKYHRMALHNGPSHVRQCRDALIGQLRQQGVPESLMSDALRAATH